jgi:hypothetical protein
MAKFANCIQPIAALATIGVFHADTPALGQTTLPTAAVRFEQNATDGDFEVVFNATGPRDGLAHLTVIDPSGRKTIDFSAPDSSTLGIRNFELESPELADVEGLKEAYPEGKYSYRATTVSGQTLTGEATLSHRLPPAATFVSPAEEAKGVPTDAEFHWQAPDSLTAIIVEVEQDGLDMNLTVRLPAGARSFPMPSGLLQPNTEYDLAIGTVSAEGNVTFVETSFSTGDN